MKYEFLNWAGPVMVVAMLGSLVYLLATYPDYHYVPTPTAQDNRTCAVAGNPHTCLKMLGYKWVPVE